MPVTRARTSTSFEPCTWPTASSTMGTRCGDTRSTFACMAGGVWDGAPAGDATGDDVPGPQPASAAISARPVVPRWAPMKKRGRSPDALGGRVVAMSWCLAGKGEIKDGPRIIPTGDRAERRILRNKTSRPAIRQVRRISAERPHLHFDARFACFFQVQFVDARRLVFEFNLRAAQFHAGRYAALLQAVRAATRQRFALAV